MATAGLNGETFEKKMTVGTEMLTKSNGAGGFGLPKLFARTEINLENCLLNHEKVNNPPSLTDGMHADTERDLRYLGSELIQTASILLKLPQVAAATGQILFQRFYYSKSFVRYDFEQTAMACVYLASKIEEAPRRMRDVINVFHHMRQLYRLRESKSSNINKKTAPMLIDQRYVAVKNDVIKAERRVLKELGFCVHVKHPHKLIVSYLRALSAENETALIQKAWNYMNDSLRTDIFLRYAPETIACACIFLAARVLDYPLPSADSAKWWELFDADESSILDACRTFLKMYARRNAPSWNQLEHHWHQLKLRLIEKQEANKISSGVETTPNPHVAGSASVEKFSPTQSRQTSPKAVESSNKMKRDDRPNGTGASSPKRNIQIGSQGQPKRKRHRSSSGESPRFDKINDDALPNRKNYLPKRYSASTNVRRNRGGVDDREIRMERSRGGEKDSQVRSQSRSISPQRRKKQRKRSRSTSRLRREQEKREREVRQAMGKKNAAVTRYR